jgi:hypothetical protein
MSTRTSNKRKLIRLTREQITSNAKARRKLEELRDTKFADDFLIGEKNALRKQAAPV